MHLVSDERVQPDRGEQDRHGLIAVAQRKLALGECIVLGDDHIE